MPLKLKLAPGERLVVNGAVMTNGHHGATLTINNHAAIMREGHILQEDDADTPTKRTYFLVQAMLLSPPPTEAQRSGYAKSMLELRACYRRPAGVELLEEVQAQVDAQNFYKALSALRRLIDYEAQLLRVDPPQWRRQAQGERVSDRGAEPGAERGSDRPSERSAAPHRDYTLSITR